MNLEFRAFVKWKRKEAKVSIRLDMESELRAIDQP